MYIFEIFFYIIVNPFNHNKIWLKNTQLSEIGFPRESKTGTLKFPEKSFKWKKYQNGSVIFKS